MTEEAPDYVPVATQDALWDGEMEPFQVNGTEILLLRVEGDYLAYQGTCPHQRQSLAEGELDGTVLTCAFHLWEFDVRTGRGINPRGSCLVRHDTRVADGRVYVSRHPSDERPAPTP